MPKRKPPSLILASQSETRKKMLRNVGLSFRAVPAHIDETLVTTELRAANKNTRNIAMTLAKEKAKLISGKFPDALVIGADQVLSQGNEIFSKAKNAQDAARKLKRLRGKTHSLISAVCVAKDGKILWSYADEAKLRMRKFNDDFLRAYCAEAERVLTRAVGAYELEGAGAWLFDKVEGDYFTVLGLPLLPLLNYLREEQGFGP